VPLPWTADAPHAGLGGEPWLPQPAGWASYAADRQARDPGSTLALYREAIRLRPAFGGGPLTWLSTADGVLAFARAGALCLVNLADTPADLPAHTALLLASGPLDPDGRLPKDTAVWLRA
jgi:alpha-glucosidase